MRKTIGWGMLAVMIGAAVFYLAGGYKDRLDEPHSVDAFLLDPAKPIEDQPLFETIDLLSLQETSNLAKQGDAGKQPPWGFISENPALDHGDDPEEQEDEGIDLLANPKAVEERLNRILQSYLRNGKFPGPAGVDTMEFRPSDAKKGEFDRLPF